MNMTVMSLGYLGMEAADPKAWGAYATDILGAPLGRVETDGTHYVRLDERSFRIAVHPGRDGKLSYIGWELADASTLERLVETLQQHKLPFTRGSQAECERRGVMGLVAVQDPAGVRNELFYGSDISAEPLRPTRDNLSGFVALGHVVLGAQDIKAVERFYTDVLGFKVSDYIEFPYGDIDLSVVFMRCGDGREHSLALQNLGEGLHHALVEVKSIDDVGRTLDLCMDKGVRIAESLGRHANDGMISFYMDSPNGVQMECGFGGIKVDDATWRVRRMNVGSIWGHRVAKS
jgi:extradiol dioxygenase